MTPMDYMHTASITIKCKNPNILKNIVDLEKEKNLTFEIKEKEIVLNLENKSLKMLSKSIYTLINDINLSNEVLNNFSE